MRIGKPIRRVKVEPNEHEAAPERNPDDIPIEQPEEEPAEEEREEVPA